MRVRRLLMAALVTGVACAGTSAVQRDGTKGTSAGREHPAVDVGLDTCFGCHARVTPQVATQWRDGRHGLSLVECVVCHGSTGADFKARPGIATCRGCHAAQVEATPVAAQGCFACHPAHSLHAAGPMAHSAKPKEASR